MAPKYTHPDEEDSPQFIGVYREWKVEVADDGTYETDADPEELVELGFLAPEDAPESDEEDAPEPTHDELKERAEELGIADEIDLRSKESIKEALDEHDAEE